MRGPKSRTASARCPRRAWAATAARKPRRCYRATRASHFDVDLSARAGAAAPISPALKPAGGALLVLQLGATNDAAGAVSADVLARCERTRELHEEATRDGRAVSVLPSGGIQANFNPTAQPHWAHVAAALAAAAAPAASVVKPGLPALHTVDEAIMARAHVLRAPAERPAELIVVTSDYHAERSAHLFGVAFGRTAAARYPTVSSSCPRRSAPM